MNYSLSQMENGCTCTTYCKNVYLHLVQYVTFVQYVMTSVSHYGISHLSVLFNFVICFTEPDHISVESYCLHIIRKHTEVPLPAKKN